MCEINSIEVLYFLFRFFISFIIVVLMVMLSVVVGLFNMSSVGLDISVIVMMICCC